METHPGRGWVEGLEEVIFQINSTVSATTGHQPYELVFGQKAKPNERILEMLGDQGLLNEEDIDSDIVEVSR